MVVRNCGDYLHSLPDGEEGAAGAMGMKVLFLDVDGVLNSEEWFSSPRATESDYLGLRSINPEAVKRILRVLEQTGAVLVLSSTWRVVPECTQALLDAGLPIADATPRIDSANRGAEIVAWLEKHHNEVEKIAVIDDDADAGDCGLRHRFVQTTWQKGIQEEHEKALVALLS